MGRRGPMKPLVHGTQYGYKTRGCRCDECRASQRRTSAEARIRNGQIPPTPEQRFWSKVDKNGPNGCWLWLGSTDRAGYGRFCLGKHHPAAHRYSWELAHGPIPDGLTYDHLCRVTSCVNPAHGEIVTRGENSRRGGGLEVARARALSRTHCKHGHELTPENTYRGDRRRGCLTCRRERSRVWHAAHRPPLDEARLTDALTNTLIRFGIDRVIARAVAANAKADLDEHRDWVAEWQDTA